MVVIVGEFPPGRSFTRADLEAMPDDGHRYELVDGVLVVSPSPRPLHQRVVLRLAVALEKVCPSDYEVLPAPVDVVLADDTVLIPDVVMGRRADFTARALEGTPALAIEVLSPRTRHFDLELKPARFQEAGCPHYWIVDPNLPQVRCWSMEADGYVETATAVGDQCVELVDPVPLQLRPTDLTADHRRARER